MSPLRRHADRPREARGPWRHRLFSRRRDLLDALAGRRDYSPPLHGLRRGRAIGRSRESREIAPGSRGCGSGRLTSRAAGRTADTEAPMRLARPTTRRLMALVATEAMTTN